MQLELDSTSNQEPPMDQNISDGILEALANNSRKRLPSKSYFSFSDPKSLVSPSGNNNLDIVCPREECGSLILKAENAKFTRASSKEVCPQFYLI